MGPAHLEVANKNKAFTRINVIKDGGEKSQRRGAGRQALVANFRAAFITMAAESERLKVQGIRKTPLSAEMEQPSVSYAKLF